MAETDRPSLDTRWYTTMSKYIDLIGNKNTSSEERAAACKDLAGLASSENTNDRMNKQNMIVDAGAGRLLIDVMLHGATEDERWWASLVLVQLTFGNERTIEALVDASVLGKTTILVKRWMIGDEALEDHLTEEEDRVCVVRAASKVLSNEVAYATDRIKYGAIHILTNIANKSWEVQDVIFAHGAVRRIVPLCKSSNTPALVAAGVGLLCSMSYRVQSRSRLMKAGATRVLDPIARTERTDLNAVSANIAKNMLRRHAASIIAALARGYRDRKKLRKEAEARKMKRLGNFLGNLVFYKSYVIWAHFTVEAQQQREKMKMAVKRLLNRTLIWAMAQMSKYVDKRHAKYDKIDVALEFAKHSVVARDLMLEKWKEYMRKHGAWWSPDDRMEAKIKERCASFVALMSGQWLSLCFQEWNQLIVKKRRAMKRWQNSAIFFGFQIWCEYMYTEGAWWEPDGPLQKLLDEKCGKFLAAMTGDYIRLAYSEWSSLVKKKKRASARWFNRCATNCFDEWHDKVFVEMYELYEKVGQKCGRVLALISGEYLQMCFRSWSEHTRMMVKGKKYLMSIKNRPLRTAFDGWIDFMCQGSWWEPEDELQALLQQKCGHLIAMMSGDFSRLVLQLWHEIARKQVIAMRRWKNQSLFAAWKDWVHFHVWESHFKHCTAAIKKRRRAASLQENLWEFISCYDERVYRRSLVGDALLMWINVRLVHAFRSLDEHCQQEKYYRFVLQRFRKRYDMRPAQRCLRALADFVARQQHLRFLMHRIKNAVVISFLMDWQDLVQETKIQAREMLVNKSPLILRWLKRPMYTCHNMWREYVAQEVRNRHILKRMKQRIEWGCVIETLNHWKVFVDVVVEERFQALKAAVADALQTGTLSVLLSSLKREQQLFHRSNVRWNEFARAYMEDALAEFSAEEARQVDVVFKRIRRRKIQKDKEHADMVARFQYVAQVRGRSRSPPKHRSRSPSPERGGPSPVQAEDFLRDSPVRQRPGEGFKQVAPKYMQRSGDYSVLKAEREEMVRDGSHMKHMITSKERSLRDERERAKRAALRKEKEAKARWALEAQQRGQVEDGSFSPHRAGWGLKDARYYSQHLAAFAGYSEKFPHERPSSGLEKQTQEDGEEGSLVGSGEDGKESPSIPHGEEGATILPPIQRERSGSFRHAQDGGSGWPWVDKRAVNFSLGVDEETYLPRLVPQRSAVIL